MTKIDKERLIDIARDLSQKYRLYNVEETTELLKSAIRLNIGVSYKKSGRRKVIELMEEELMEFFEAQVLPNTILLDFNDKDVVELMLFSIEFAFSMFEGKTRATKSQKGFRERTRDMETIVVNSFVGSIGEVAVKKFLKERFNKEIELDRSISRDINRYRSDILNSKEPVSIKTSPNLSAIYSECPLGYSVGVFVKVSVQRAVLMSLFAHVCGFRNLLNFSREILGSSTLVDRLSERIYAKECGSMNSTIKCYICGYMETERLKHVEKGERLPYFGEVREPRYILPLRELKSSTEDWKLFCNKYL
ncbi:MAG: hypothetical protein RMK75_08125 [Aquificaceae bacterium]|nr:hypothetical protein [Aquificaceae bacterium]MDW8424268.1 hypothetical protein [Aquificaceae bacterium]